MYIKLAINLYFRKKKIIYRNFRNFFLKYRKITIIIRNRKKIFVTSKKFDKRPFQRKFWNILEKICNKFLIGEKLIINNFQNI